MRVSELDENEMSTACVASRVFPSLQAILYRFSRFRFISNTASGGKKARQKECDGEKKRKVKMLVVIFGPTVGEIII